jgi:hypothetical protein
MYRDESEATRLRIETLEAKLAERDAALAARDAEISELTARVARLSPEPARGPKPRSSWPILLGAMAFLIGASGALFTGIRPRAQPSPAHNRMEPRTTTTVAACDEYLFRVELCLNRLDPSLRNSLGASLHGTRESWWLTATAPASRGSLTVMCQQALDDLAMSPLCD